MLNRLKAWVLVVATGLFISCGGGMPEVPQALRHDLFFGYYLTLDNQVEETMDHVNLVHESGWFGDAATIASMKRHGKPTMLGVSLNTLRQTLINLQQEGLLPQVVALYPVDEPDLIGMTDEQVTSQNAQIRVICSEFPELQNVKLAVIYTNKDLLPGFDSYDWVSMDAYEMGSEVLNSQQWKHIMARLGPNQRVFLVPGGGDPWQQDPEAFRRYAHNTPQVVGILAFLWAVRHDDRDNPNMPGIGQNGMAPVYRALGKELINNPQ